MKRNKHSPKAPSASGAKAAQRPKSGANPAAVSKNDIQGEGNYEAARAFNEAELKFVKSGKVAAAPKSDAEQQAMLAAEEQGKRRAKE